MGEIERQLRERWVGFPGVVVAQARNAGSRVIEGSSDEYEAVLVFEDGLDGEVAALVTEHFLSGKASWVRRAGPVRREEAASDGGPASVCLIAGEAPMRMLVRNFGYASARMHAREGGQAEEAKPQELEAAGTLPALLSHALVAFTREYGEAPAAGFPSLPVWANVLRAVGPQGGTEAEVRERAIVSRRVLRVVLRELTQMGWLAVEDPTPGQRGKARLPKRIHLTEQGHAMARAGRERVAEVESRWEQRFGGEAVGRLREALAGVAAGQDLELPHYLVGYGIADASLTGGSYLPAEPGPPRKPARGEEWPVVPRASEPPSLTLPALLSWALTAFTLDYEAHELGSLAWASVFLKHVPDEGMPLGEARRLCDVVGNGRSGPERHLCVVVTPGKPSDMSRTVYLTPKSKRVRDAWPWLVQQVEREWQERFGGTVADLRQALEGMDVQAWAGLPDYPDTTSWVSTLHLRSQGQADTLLDQRDTGSGINLAWHAGQRPVTTRD